MDMGYRFRRNGQIIFKEGSGGGVLVDPYRRAVISLDEVGLEIWALVDGARSIQDIVSALEDIFQVDGKMLERDVLGFLKDLMRREAIL